MKRLPRSITGILIFLTVLYNLERITVADMNLIDIKGFVYALILVVIILVLQVKFVRDQTIATLMITSLLVYLVGKFVVFRYWTIWDQNSSYLIITEVAFLWLAILLAHRTGTYMQDFEESVKNISFSGSEHSKELSKTTEDIRLEMYRSRRYGHPLTMVIIEPETLPPELDLNIAIKEVQMSMMGRYYATNMARAIHNDLRLVDMIIDIDKGKRFAILYPETTRENALPLIERVYSIAKKMGITMRAGVASFPEDAVTFEELLHKSVVNLGVPDFPKVDKEKTSKSTESKEGVD